MPKSKDKGKIHMKRKPEPSTSDSSSKPKDLNCDKQCSDSADSALADITDSPIKFKKLNFWKDESQDSYCGGQSGSQDIFPSQVLLVSEDITEKNEDSFEKEGSKNSLTGEQSTAYAHSNFEELHDVMVKIFRTVLHRRVETFSEASREFLHFCAVVVSTRNDELLEMIEQWENSHTQ